jgi:hypothetical protein
MLLDEYVRVFLYFSLANSEKKTSDRDSAQSRYRVFSGRESQLLIILPETAIKKRKKNRIINL